MHIHFSAAIGALAAADRQLIRIRRVKHKRKNRVLVIYRKCIWYNTPLLVYSFCSFFIVGSIFYVGSFYK